MPSGVATMYFCNFIPGDIDVHMAETRILEGVYKHLQMIVQWLHDPAKTAMRPDYRRFGMPPEQIANLFYQVRLLPFFWIRHVDIAVHQNDQSNFRCKIIDPVERRVGETRLFPCDF